MTLHPRPDRVQTGVRMERRLVKVLKAVAELRDLSLGELLEVVVYDVFAGRLPFDGAGLVQVRELLAIYGAVPAPAAPAALAPPEDQP
jgi:hypothetical protein